MEVVLADKNGEYGGIKEVYLWRTGNKSQEDLKKIYLSKD